MVDKEKIIIMTNLAVYDKNHGEADRKANTFFRHDYIYWQNFWARLYALLGCLIIISFYIIERIVINQEDLFEIDYSAEGVRILLFIVVVLFICSSISSLKATREYSRIQKRIEKYIELTEKLEGEGELPAYYGANTNRKRRKR
ncbi:MAG: hypothetical protein FWE24_00640 [Defluviitaleaceae bacterium]|nr:hypothetical protein [Defluviitaleaceae bacterium]